MMQQGQGFDRIYGLGHLAEDPWAAKDHHCKYIAK